MKEFYNFIVLADIHIGQYDIAEHYNRELKQIIDEISKYEIIDCIFIAGDYFHASYSIESEEAKYGLYFMMKIVDICKQKNSKLRIIKGTKSHDNNQLEVFNFIQNEIDYRYFDTVSEELLFPNLKILYVPEEYITNKKEYYKDYFSKEKEYDIILFHGLFENAIPVIKEMTSEIHLPKAPIFTTQEMKKCCKGVCIGGHIHNHMKLDDFVYYTGSLSRSAHGEEKDKGYCVVNYDANTSQYILNFKENKYVKIYKVLKVGNAFEDLSVDDMIKYIEEYKNRLKCDFLRVDLDQNVTNDKSQANLSLLREYYFNNKNISIRLNLHKKRIQELKEDEDEIDKITEEYKFLIDGTPLEEQFVQFAHTAFQRDIRKDEVKHYLEEE